MQELKQSTLDEIFTLIEPYLKLPEPISREMGVSILNTSLKTFLQNFDFRVSPSALAFNLRPMYLPIVTLNSNYLNLEVGFSREQGFEPANLRFKETCH